MTISSVLKDPRALLLDYDGTCTPKGQGSTLNVLEQRLLTGAVRTKSETLRRRFDALMRDHTLTPVEAMEWLHGELALFVEDRMDEADMRDVIAMLRFREGMPELIRDWQKFVGPVAIASYSAAQPIEWMLARADLVGVEVMATRLEFRNGKMCGWTRGTEVLPSNKGEWARRFCLRHDLRYEDACAVGDTSGDANLGPFANRVGIARDERDRANIARHFSEVYVTESIAPIRAHFARLTGAAL